MAEKNILMSDTNIQGTTFSKESEAVWSGGRQAHGSTFFPHPWNGATWHADTMQGALSQLSPCVGVWVALLNIG